MNPLPVFVSLLFIATTLLTVYFLYRASHYSKPFLYVMLGWLTLTGILGYLEFYTDTQSLPPRFVLLPVPAFLAIGILFMLPRGRLFIDNLNRSTLTLLHVVRFPVELVLFFLCMYGWVPELMTFEGRNFDIFSGLSAPLIWYFGYNKKSLPPTFIKIWNILCLILLANIVTHAILAAETPFQQLAFDQPNKGVLYFPFVWLPGFVVPAVFLSHVALLRCKIRSN